MHAFDRQTDRRTDRILIARPRPHCMQRGKKKAKALVRDDKLDNARRFRQNAVSRYCKPNPQV